MLGNFIYSFLKLIELLILNFLTENCSVWYHCVVTAVYLQEDALWLKDNTAVVYC